MTLKPESSTEEEEAPTEETPAEKPAPTTPKPQITVDLFELSGGNVRFNDNKVEPPYRGVIEGLDVTVHGIDAMAPRAEKVVVDAKLPGGARLDVDGRLDLDDGDLRLDLKRMDLPTVNPYAVRVMHEVGIDISAHHSKSIDAIDHFLGSYDASIFDEKRFIHQELQADAALYRDPRFLEGLRALLEQRVPDFSHPMRPHKGK